MTKRLNSELHLVGSEPSDEEWMRYALRLAQRANDHGEVPVGAVVVANGVLLGEGWNRPIADCDPSAHAEIVALRSAGRRLGNYRLTGATLFVTLEPCMMCRGAIVQARIDRVVYGAYDSKVLAGEANSTSETATANHWPPFQGGVLAYECAALLHAFFRARRRSATIAIQSGATTRQPAGVFKSK